jgi:hypothetical protein
MKRVKLARKDRKAMEEMEKYLKLKKYTRESLDADMARWMATLRLLKEARDSHKR